MFEILFIVVNRFLNSFYLIIGNINSLVKAISALQSSFFTILLISSTRFWHKLASFLSLTFVLVYEIMFLKRSTPQPHSTSCSYKVLVQKGVMLLW